MREAILVHCRRELPSEACGLIAGDAPAGNGGRPTRWLPARNVHASPYRYELHPDDLVRLTLELDDAGEVVWAIVHSHVSSAAVPSATDVREARYPEALQLVVGLGDPAGGGTGDPAGGGTGDPAGELVLRLWRITGGGVSEIPVIWH